VIEPDTGVSGKPHQTNDLPQPAASLKNRYSKYRFKRQSIFGSEPVLGHLWPFQRPWIYIGETGIYGAGCWNIWLTTVPGALATGHRPLPLSSSLRRTGVRYSKNS
jgi:hypothetical protein